MSRKKKVAKLRRSRRPFADFIRRFWVAGVLVAFALAYGGWVLANSRTFAVKRVVVEGVQRVPAQTVAKRAAIVAGTNIWLLDAPGIERRVEAIPYVATARVHRSPPSTVRVVIIERAPEGCVKTVDGDELTIDAEQRVLERRCSRGTVVFFPRAVEDATPGRFLHDAELARLQKDARTLDQSGERFTDFRYDRFGELEARLADGIRVRFGDEEDLERKRRLIGPILASLGNRIGGIRAIDLRAPATPVIESK